MEKESKRATRKNILQGLNCLMLLVIENGGSQTWNHSYFRCTRMACLEKRAPLTLVFRTRQWKQACAMRRRKAGSIFFRPMLQNASQSRVFFYFRIVISRQLD